MAIFSIAYHEFNALRGVEMTLLEIVLLRILVGNFHISWNLIYGSCVNVYPP